MYNVQYVYQSNNLTYDVTMEEIITCSEWLIRACVLEDIDEKKLPVEILETNLINIL